MSFEGFDDVGLRYVGGRWVWLEFDFMDQVESVKTSKALKEIFFGSYKMFITILFPDEDFCVLIDLVVAIGFMAPEGCIRSWVVGGKLAVFRIMVSDGPMSHGKVCVLQSLYIVVIVGYVTTDDKRMLLPVYLLLKSSIIAPIYTPGNDVNIAVEFWSS
ncbi:hypothetical protein Tco_1133036 [Tanacetum coccineum]|uniref:Uncharacterized protein n=1 Tax=Tanacetum coccineum TaxID=301880 RepID=A0ABQ5JF98_9ASTR